MYPSRIVPLEIFMARKFSIRFSGVLLKALGIFLGFEFCPHSIIPVTWNPEYPPWASSPFLYHRCFHNVINSFIVQHPGPEPDLTATLPLDPREYTDVFSPPIVLPSQKISSGGDNHFHVLCIFTWIIINTPFALYTSRLTVFVLLNSCFD